MSYLLIHTFTHYICKLACIIPSIFFDRNDLFPESLSRAFRIADEIKDRSLIFSSLFAPDDYLYNTTKLI